MLIRRNRAALLPAALLAALSFAGGCAMPRTETFDIDVRNATPRPLTISLAKDSESGRPGPFEAAWASPEEVAARTQRARERWGIDVIPPGAGRQVRALKGKFDEHTRGVLRAYAGDLSISQMLSKDHGSPERVDVPLFPGRNDITIVDKDGHIAAQIRQDTPAR